MITDLVCPSQFIFIYFWHFQVIQKFRMPSQILNFDINSSLFRVNVFGELFTAALSFYFIFFTVWLFFIFLHEREHPSSIIFFVYLCLLDRDRVLWSSALCQKSLIVTIFWLCLEGIIWRDHSLLTSNKIFKPYIILSGEFIHFLLCMRAHSREAPTGQWAKEYSLLAQLAFIQTGCVQRRVAQNDR